jgi:hypothetical protein
MPSTVEESMGMLRFGSAFQRRSRQEAIVLETRAAGPHTTTVVVDGPEHVGSVKGN